MAASSIAQTTLMMMELHCGIGHIMSNAACCLIMDGHVSGIQLEQSGKGTYCELYVHAKA